MSSSSGRILILFFAGLLVSAELSAQPRGPATRTSRSAAQQSENPRVIVDEPTRAKKTAEMETWLRHLEGRFKFDARYAYAGGEYPISGDAICSIFGQGPGVRCVIRQTSRSPGMRLSILQVESVREDATLPLFYFGINAEKLEIQAIVVDKEQVSAQSGVLSGQAASFADNWNACLRIWARCWMVSEITAGTTNEFFMKITIDHWFQGSKGPPIALMKSGHSAELEMKLFRVLPTDASD